MKNKNIVGVLLLTVILSSAIVLIWFPQLVDLRNVTQSRMIVAYFDNIGNLANKAKVTTSGVTVGHVDNISLAYNNKQARVLITIEDEKLQIPEDSIAQIVSTSLFGQHYIDISLGKSSNNLQDTQVLVNTQSAMYAEDLIRNIFLRKALLTQ
jgi:phospholipid/cholesterol/gamma-HCH transport system substrate-binding protein